MRHRAAELLGGDLLVRHGLHDVGAGDEHVGGVLDHEDEVGHRRRVDRAAGAGAHDQRDLRHDARGQHVALEDVGVAGERDDALVDARAAGVVDADHRDADAHRVVHDLADLLGVRLRERAAEDREVLREDEDRAAVDRAVAGDDAVAGHRLAGHVEVGAAVLDEHVPLLEAALVEQQLDALAGGELALGVVGVDALAPAAEAGGGALLLELLQNLLHAGIVSSLAERKKADIRPFHCVTPRYARSSAAMSNFFIFRNACVTRLRCSRVPAHQPAHAPPARSATRAPYLSFSQPHCSASGCAESFSQ